MERQLKCKVVMTPSEAAPLVVQSLILVSTRQIRFDDWYFDGKECHRLLTDELPLSTDLRVEASNKPEMGLPLIPISFIQAYMDSCRIKKPITEVMIAMENWIDTTSNDTSDMRPKTRKDRTVVVRPVKEGWSKDEVIVLCHKMIEMYGENGREEELKKEADKWLEENL